MSGGPSGLHAVRFGAVMHHIGMDFRVIIGFGAVASMCGLPCRIANHQKRASWMRLFAKGEKPCFQSCNVFFFALFAADVWIAALGFSPPAQGGPNTHALHRVWSR